MKNSRNKQFVSLKLRTVLSSVMESCQECDHPLVRRVYTALPAPLFSGYFSYQIGYRRQRRRQRERQRRKARSQLLSQYIAVIVPFSKQVSSAFWNLTLLSPNTLLLPKAYISSVLTERNPERMSVFRSITHCFFTVRDFGLWKIP